MEVMMLKKFTLVKKHKERLSYDRMKMPTNQPTIITLNMLPDISNSQKVSVNIKAYITSLYGLVARQSRTLCLTCTAMPGFS